MDYKSAADEAARRVLDQVERDGCLHQSSIARVIEDELHRANRAPRMMMGAPDAYDTAWMDKQLALLAKELESVPVVEFKESLPNSVVFSLKPRRHDPG